LGDVPAQQQSDSEKLGHIKGLVVGFAAFELWVAGMFLVLHKTVKEVLES
jgi:hypothetical protein